MTTEQKRQISSYRAQGKKYAEIARIMDMPVTTVKSYCHKYLTEDKKRTIPAEPVCPQCGKPIQKSKYRPRRFCSDTCRNDYWREHQSEINRASAIVTLCQCCHKPITDYANHARKYCSHKCYIAGRYGGERND